MAKKNQNSLLAPKIEATFDRAGIPGRGARPRSGNQLIMQMA